jgi:hypothetical protein
MGTILYRYLSMYLSMYLLIYIYICLFISNLNPYTFFLAKYSLLYSIKKHGIPKIYRSLLKYNLKITPLCHRNTVKRSLRICAKTPQAVASHLNDLDSFLFKVIKVLFINLSYFNNYNNKYILL